MSKKKVTEKMKAKIERMREWFYSRTKGGFISNYLNGFIGVGIFKKPRKHSTLGTNTVWLFSCGMNDNGSRIVEQTNLELTLDEAKDLLRCLRIALKRDKEMKEAGK